MQVSVLAEDILKNVEFDALRIVFNKFQLVVSFVPTVSTVLSPEVNILPIICCLLFANCVLLHVINVNFFDPGGGKRVRIRRRGW